MRKIILGFLFLSSTLSFAETGDVRINNPRVDGAYYKFELQVRRTDAWDTGLGKIGGLGDSDWYFNYNSNAFGSQNPAYENLNSTIATNNSDGNVDYSFIVQENGGKLQVKCSLLNGSPLGEPSTADDLFTLTLDTWVTLLTVTWEIDDTGENSNITWDQVNTGMQDGDGDPITITYYGDGDISLPVQMTGLEAAILQNGIELTWSTESELENLGFHIYRAADQNGTYTRITNNIIEGQGNTSSRTDYEFVDSGVPANGTYFYQIESISTDGTQEIIGQIRVDAANVFPEEFALSQNFPNPFNPDTEIKYDVPEANFVNITVYNLLGQKVKTLLDMQIEPGYHSVKWNGTSDAGLLAGSGVYIVRIVADDFTAIKKMMLMR